MVKKEKVGNKQQIISEYLTGSGSYAELSTKYGVNARTIQTWVRSFRERQEETTRLVSEETETDIRELKKQLKQAELKNELLSEMLQLSEEHTGIDLRKKFGFKP